MTPQTAPINMALYRVLLKHGASEAEAEAAARLEASELATKADLAALKLDVIELKAELIKWNVGTLVALTGIFAAIVKLL
jgi:hypothetical protein